MNVMKKEVSQMFKLIQAIHSIINIAINIINPCRVNRLDSLKICWFLMSHGNFNNRAGLIEFQVIKNKILTIVKSSWGFFHTFRSVSLSKFILMLFYALFLETR